MKKKGLLFFFVGLCLSFAFAFAVAGCDGKKKVIDESYWVGADPVAQVYTGQAITFTVSLDGLTEGTDFEVAFSDNVNAGTGKVTVYGIGEYSGSFEKTFTISKATPVIEGELGASDLYLGMSLAESSISGSSSVSGEFKWKDGSIVPSAGGTYEYDAEFIPSDTANYNSVSVGKVSVFVKSEKLPEIIAEPTSSAIKYGQPLSDSVLTGGEASVAGTFTWSEPDAVLSAATEVAEVVFTPDDDNYVSVTMQVAVTIEKLKPEITAPTAAEVVYSHQLKDSVLSGGSANGVEGIFVWKDETVMPAVKNEGYTVVFIPNDEANYEQAEITVAISVLPLDVQVEVTGILHEYNGKPKNVTVTLTPDKDSMDQSASINLKYTLTYQAESGEATQDAPAEKGEYAVKLALDENLNPSQTEFVMGIKSFITLSGENKLFSKYDGMVDAPVFNVGDDNSLDGLKKVLVGDTVFEEGKFTIEGKTVSVDAEVLKTVENGIHEVMIETPTDVYTASVYVCDVVITAENADDYLTNAGAKTLAVSHNTTYPGTSLIRLNMYYVFATDVDLEGKAFRGIGRASASSVGNASGTFDGNGHVVRNWTCSDTITGNGGFIGTLLNGKLMNLGLENIEINVDGSTKQCFIGALAGAISGVKISNCYVKDFTVNIGGAFKTRVVGGLFGSNNGASTLENCILYGNVSVEGASALYGIGYLANNAARPLTVKNVYVASEGFLSGSGLLAVSNFITNENSSYKTSEELLTADYSAYAAAGMWNVAESGVPTLKPIWEI